MINEEWLKEQLIVMVCDGNYVEGTLKSKVDKIKVYDSYILFKGYSGANIKQETEDEVSLRDSGKQGVDCDE